MKLLGLGAAGCAKFCGLMNMSPFLRQTSYDMILKNIFTTVKDVFGQFASFAVRQEMNEYNGPINNHLTVYVHGTWYMEETWMYFFIRGRFFDWV